MIKVVIKKKDNTINEVVISGHAEYAEKGYDIVCSAVSSVVITTVNGLLSYNYGCLDYHESADDLKISILKHDKIVDNFIENMLNLLKELEKDYKDYIKFIK